MHVPNLIFWYFWYVPKWYYFHFTWMLDFSGLVVSIPCSAVQQKFTARDSLKHLLWKAGVGIKRIFSNPFANKNMNFSVVNNKSSKAS